MADDIRDSFHEALDYAAGRKTKAKAHRISPDIAGAREARMKLGLMHPDAQGEVRDVD